MEKVKNAFDKLESPHWMWPNTLPALLIAETINFTKKSKLNAGYQHFLLFLPPLQKAPKTGSLRVKIGLS